MELVYYYNGVGKSTIDSKRYPIKSGVFTITPSGIYHDQENFTEIRSFCILLNDKSIEHVTGSWIDIDGSIRRLLFSLFAESREKRTGYQDICIGLVYEIVGRAERIVHEWNQVSHPTKQDIVDRAIELIREREGLITVSDVADSVNVSTDYLRHLFHQLSDKSPHRHIIDAKLEKSMKFLSETDISVSQIADQCGFNDVYYFSNIFKKAISISPKAYRQRMQNSGSSLITKTE